MARNAQQLLTSLQYFKATERYANHLGRTNIRSRNLMFNGKVF